MAAKPVGKMVVSLDLETAAYTKAQKKILSESKEAANTINGNFQRLGVTSDEIYTAMATRAELAFRKIGLSAKASLAEVERSYAAMVVTTNTAKQQMANNPLFTSLGIRSIAAIEAQKAAVIATFEAIKTIGFKNDQERINATRAYNAKLKELNKEMTGDHEMSMASMTRAVLRFYAAWYVASAGVGVIKNLFMGGVQSIDDMKTNVIAVAAQITSMQGTTGNVAENYRKNVEYAKALVPILMQVDAVSFANFQQISLMNRAAVNHGVILNTNNKKQIEGFTAVTNAVTLLTTGQNKEIQASQEINALVTGRIRSTDMVAMSIDGIIKNEGKYKGGLEEIVKLSKEHNDLWERLAPYMVGITAASADISTTWQAVSASMETTWGILQRGLFKSFYKELTQDGAEANKWLKKNADDIVKSVETIANGIKYSLEMAAGFAAVVALTAAWTALSAAWAAGTLILKLNSAALTAWNYIVGGPSVLAVKTLGAAMKAAAGVAVAFFAGWEIGTLLNKFESVRKFGVDMVYGIMDYWALFVKGVKQDWELIAYIAKMAKATFTKEKYADVTAEFTARVTAIQTQYDKEKAVRDQYHKDQLKDVTDQAIREAKAKADATKNTAPPPPPGGNPPPDEVKDSVKDHMEILRAKMQADKAYYDEVVKSAEQAAKLSQRAGQDEYKTIQTLYDAKRSALLRYRIVEIENAEAQVKLESDAAKISKDGVAKRYDEEAVLSAKIQKINATTIKGINENEGSRAIAVEDANQKTLATMANLYKTIGDYSKASLDTQIEQIKEKYKNDGRYAKATAEQRIVLEKAMATEIFNLRNEAERKVYDMQLSYLRDMGQEYSDTYREIAILKIKNEADALEREFQNAAGGGGQTQAQQDQLRAEQDLTLSLLTEWEERLIAYANYLSAMGDKEGNKKAADAATEMSRKKIELQDRVTQHALAAQQKIFDKTEYINKKILDSDTKAFIERNEKISTGIQSMETAFTAISSMYAEGSSEHEKWTEAAKAMMVAQKAIAVVNAVAAVAAASAAPFPAGFVAGAAMLASMVSLLGSIGTSIGGGGESISASSAAYGQSTTVLGGANGQASESITKSWELMQDTYDMEYRELSGIYDQMKNLNQNITGLVNSIIRTGGVSVAGVTVGDSIGFAEKNARSYINDDLGILSKFGNFANQPVVDIVNAIFGGGSKSWASNTGINTGATSISDLISGKGVGAQAYTTVTTEHDGGWFSDNWTSRETIYGKLDRNVTEMMDKVFTNMGQTIVSLAEGLGTDINAALSYTFATEWIDLQGLDADGISKKLNEVFSAIGDNAVEALFGEVLRGYQEIGEGLMETATRLLIDKAVVIDTLTMTGQAFVGTIPQVIAFSEALIKMAGDLETLRGYAETYYDKFYSDTEKQAGIQKHLTDVMAMMNLVLPETRAGYRDLVEAIDMTKESGQEAYVTLLQASEMADEYYTALEEATGANQDFVDSLKDITTTIKEWLDNLSLSNLAPVQSAAEWNRQYMAQKATASGANATTENVSDYLNFATKYLEFQKAYGTTQSYQAIYDAVVSDVTGVGAGKNAALDIAQKQLDALNVIAANTAVSDAYAAQMAPYNAAIKANQVALTTIYKDFLKENPADQWATSATGKAAWAAYTTANSAAQSLLNSIFILPPEVHDVGGFTNGLEVVGGKGTELIVPTYNPQNKSFLKTVGADPETLGAAIGKYLQSSNGGSGEATIHNHIYIDGKEIRYVVTRGFKTDEDMIASARKAVN